MIRGKLLFSGTTACYFFLIVYQTCIATDTNHRSPSACGSTNISYPFRLQTDPSSCGDYRYNLWCENNFPVLYRGEAKYYVQAINYDNLTIRLVDAGVDKDNCSSIPHFPLNMYNFTRRDPFTWYRYKGNDSEGYLILSRKIIFIKCLNYVRTSHYVNTSPCTKELHTYAHIGEMRTSDLRDNCSIKMMSLLRSTDSKQQMSTFIEIHREMAFGFELSWHNIYCGKCSSGQCYLDSKNHVKCIICYNEYYDGGIKCRKDISSTFSIVLEMIIITLQIAFQALFARNLCGTPCVIAFLIYKWRRRHLSGYKTIEEFLQSQNNLMPIRYAYSDVRKMTRGFKEKLGEGGFGSVYKGKLRSGQLAAIKVLEKSKANGQDFINEVATIGRIHHANVVRLIGFCSERSKQALIYEFMSNGSLDNHIFPRQESTFLSWEKLCEISLGVARGIEYLHRGCDMQILHFDIKPHNILVDENFTPKISDFGLAKLYPKRDSIASLTAARGTIGYMAPELFYKNIGRVSYKADVYSFGMLLLEMAGKRKNLNALAENSSQIYYPFWVYDQLIDGKLALGDTTEEENEIARKMIITGLWCIQMQPSNRPPMNKVVEMLEGDLGILQLPPRPVLYPAESIQGDGEESSSSISV